MSRSGISSPDDFLDLCNVVMIIFVICSSILCMYVCVCVVYKGSQYVSNSNAVYDLFLTSAVTDGLKLWDLRSNRFVSQSGFRVLSMYYFDNGMVIKLT